MNPRIDFDDLPWESPLPGVRFKAFMHGARQVRLLEFSPGFEEPDWCTRGHAGRVLEGSLTLRFRDGDEHRLVTGDTFSIEAGDPRGHRAVLGLDESARLLLFEAVEPAARSRLDVPRLADPAVVLIDVQPGFEAAVAATAHGAKLDLSPLMLRFEKLLVMADCLGFPTLATFERPDENGWLPEALECVWPAGGRRHVKQTYDCCGEPEITQAIADMGRTRLLVAGAETDVCVLQSVLSLLERGHDVFLLEDCLFTTEADPAAALRRMEAAGAVPGTLKTAFYELQKTAAVWDDAAVLGPRWERLLPLFGEPELWPVWPPLA